MWNPGFILIIVIAVVGMIVQARLQSVFKKYSQVMFPGGLTGREVAEKMLHDNGIYDVKVTATQGHLTDHYNPATKTVNLSESVYNSNSVSAAAVAAHECGHAVQHARDYAAEDAFGAGAHRAVLVDVVYVGDYCRYPVDQYFPGTVLGGDRDDRIVGAFQPCNASGRVQCFGTRDGLAREHAYAARGAGCAGTRGPVMGCAHLPGSRPVGYRNADLLPRVCTPQLNG